MVRISYLIVLSSCDVVMSRVLLPDALDTISHPQYQTRYGPFKHASVRPNIQDPGISLPMEPPTDNDIPSVGDQHRGAAGSIVMANATATTANPFEEPQRRINEYTAQEIATLQARLDKKLGPEYISARPGAAGQKVHYLSADKCINLANEVFGFNGWSSSIQTIQIDFVRLLQVTHLRRGLTDAYQSGRGEPNHRQDQLGPFSDYESYTPRRNFSRGKTAGADG